MITSINRRRNQEGFTLIELLVVIIILGVLSSVVVFAVRGVGDKGQANAVAIDARTIKTAEEAHCAQFGRYASSDELFAKKFLSDMPTYNLVNVTPTGPCNGTGYAIAQASTLGTTGQWASLPSPIVPAGDLIRLADGKVLAISTTFDPFSFDPNTNIDTQVWDPATGQWARLDTSPFTTAAGLINYSDPFSPFTGNCSSGSVNNCGKILILRVCLAPCQPLALFNPAAASGSQWELLPYDRQDNEAKGVPISLRTPFQAAPMVRFGGSSCGVACGRVVIRDNDGAIPEADRTWDLFNPADNTLTTYSYLDAAGNPELDGNGVSVASQGILTALPGQSKVLSARECLVKPSYLEPPQPSCNAPNIGSRFIDPAAVRPTSITCPTYVNRPYDIANPQKVCSGQGVFTVATSPPQANFVSGDGPAPPVLPSGDLLFSGNNGGYEGNISMLYTPSTGAWKEFPGCTTTTFDPLLGLNVSDNYYCFALAGGLPGGKVLGFPANYGRQALDNAGQTWIYTPAAAGVAGSWVRSDDWVDGRSGSDALFLTAPGCGSYCGRVLSAGVTAEFYTP